MNDSIGGRIRGRRRSRSMNTRPHIQPVPFIGNSRSLRRSSRRTWQRRENTISTDSMEQNRNDDEMIHNARDIQSPEQTQLLLFANTYARQQNLLNNQMVHPERRAQLENNDRRRNNLANTMLRQDVDSDVQDLIEGLQQQINELRVQAQLPNFISSEQRQLIEKAKTESVYDQLDVPEQMDEKENPSDHDYRQYKELFQAYEKITPSTDLIEWFTNFEYACNVYRIPATFRYLKLTTKLFNETIKTKFMAQRLTQDLSTYINIKRWLIDLPTIRKYVKKHLEAVFTWKQKYKTLEETYKHYKQTVMNYVRSIKTAMQMGLPTVEIAADRPT